MNMYNNSRKSVEKMRVKCQCIINSAKNAKTTMINAKNYINK